LVAAEGSATFSIYRRTGSGFGKVPGLSDNLNRGPLLASPFRKVRRVGSPATSSNNRRDNAMTTGVGVEGKLSAVLLAESVNPLDHRPGAADE
jgi:hypothetical protein